MLKIRSLERISLLTSCPSPSTSSSARLHGGTSQGWTVIFDRRATAAAPFAASPHTLPHQSETESTVASERLLHSVGEGSRSTSLSAIALSSIHPRRSHFRSNDDPHRLDNFHDQNLLHHRRGLPLLPYLLSDQRPLHHRSHRRHHHRSFSTSFAIGSSLKQVEIQDFVATLDEEGRLLLAQELKSANEAEVAAADEAGSRPSWAQLRAVCVHSMLPFVGFGFLDNALMIIAGDYIDTTIGVTLGISTMAAAGFGNLFSDLAGLGCAHYIEALALLLGFRAPKLSLKQKEMAITRFSGNFGRAVGVTIGCLLGMFPLLFLGGRDDHCDEEKTTQSGGVGGGGEADGTDAVEGDGGVTAVSAEPAVVVVVGGETGEVKDATVGGQQAVVAATTTTGSVMDSATPDDSNAREGVSKGG